MLVTGYMRVKKQVPKNSPERLNIREFNLSQREKVAEAKRLERQFGRSLQDTASDRSRQAAMRLKSTADLVGRYAERFEPSGGIPVAKALRKLECEMRSVCSWLGFVGEIYLNDEDH